MKRRIGPFEVQPIGLGCMNLSHAYGTPPPREAAKALLERALEIGVDFFDTAALYGFGANETLVGEVLAPHRDRFMLASKCGIQGVDGVRVIDGRPETLKKSCEDSLRRLRTEVIDLFYLHRWDKHKVPIEDSVGALAELVREGKVRAIGLSEVSSATLRRAHAVHPIAAVQSEYSLWSRDVEAQMLPTCAELGTAFVAFSPVARGFLGGELGEPSGFEPKDLRRAMPRFQPEVWAHNKGCLVALRELAGEVGCTTAQLGLAWVLGYGEQVLAIPGTTQVGHLESNVAASAIRLSPEQRRRAEAALAPILGHRYAPATVAEIDSD
nr:aldo/keto reductase [Pelomonas sp. KK5]